MPSIVSRTMAWARQSSRHHSSLKTLEISAACRTDAQVDTLSAHKCAHWGKAESAISNQQSAINNLQSDLFSVGIAFAVAGCGGTMRRLLGTLVILLIVSQPAFAQGRGGGGGARGGGGGGV